MTETNINLGCAKINIKRDTYHYAPKENVAKEYKAYHNLRDKLQRRISNFLNIEKSKGITLKEMHKKLNLNYKNVNRLLDHDTVGISLEALVKAAINLDFDIDIFIKEKNNF